MEELNSFSLFYVHLIPWGREKGSLDVGSVILWVLRKGFIREGVSVEIEIGEEGEYEDRDGKRNGYIKPILSKPINDICKPINGRDSHEWQDGRRVVPEKVILNGKVGNKVH